MATPIDSVVAPENPGDSPAVRNVRADLGDKVLAEFLKAKKIAAANTDNVDALTPATLIYVSILQHVPQDKTASAGYAEVLLAYGQALLSFARHSISQVAILGGDVEAAALEANLKESLRSKAAGAASSSKSPNPTATETKQIENEAKDTSVKLNGASEGADKKDKAVDEKAEKKPAEPSPENIEKKETKSEVKSDEKGNGAKENGEKPAEPSPQETEKSEAKSDVKPDEKGNEPKENGEKPAEPLPEKTEISETKSEAKPDEKGNGAKENGKEPAANSEKPIENLDDNKNQEGDEEEEEELDNESLTWEQLEYARRVFEDLGHTQRPRLADVYESLGDLLLESDQMPAAAVEYGKAIAILKEAKEPQIRIISLLHYQRYLALRRDVPQDAVTALTESVEAFAAHVTKAKEAESKKADSKADGKETDAKKTNSKIVEFEEILSQMRDELKSFRSALPADALESELKKKKESEGSDEITVVQPRRRAKPAEEKEAEVTVVQPRRRMRKVMEADDESADEKEEPASKKARTEDGVVEAGENGGGAEMTDISQKKQEESKEKDSKAETNGQNGEVEVKKE